MTKHMLLVGALFLAACEVGDGLEDFEGTIENVAMQTGQCVIYFRVERPEGNNTRVYRDRLTFTPTTGQPGRQPDRMQRLCESMRRGDRIPVNTLDDGYPRITWHHM